MSFGFVNKEEPFLNKLHLHKVNVNRQTHLIKKTAPN